MHKRPHSSMRYPLWYGATNSPRLWVDIGSGMGCTFGSLMPAENISQSPPNMSIEAQAVNIGFAQPLEGKDCGAAVTCNQQVLPGLRQPCEHKVDNEADLLAWAKYRGHPVPDAQADLDIHGEYYGCNTTYRQQQWGRTVMRTSAKCECNDTRQMLRRSAQSEFEPAHLSSYRIRLKSDSSQPSRVQKNSVPGRMLVWTAICPMDCNCFNAPELTRYGPDEQAALHHSHQCGTCV